LDIYITAPAEFGFGFGFTTMLTTAPNFGGGAIVSCSFPFYLAPGETWYFLVGLGGGPFPGLVGEWLTIQITPEEALPAIANAYGGEYFINNALAGSTDWTEIFPDDGTGGGPGDGGGGSEPVPVPEPGSVGLLVLGFFGLWASSKKRRYVEA